MYKIAAVAAQKSASGKLLLQCGQMAATAIGLTIQRMDMQFMVEYFRVKNLLNGKDRRGCAAL